MVEQYYTLITGSSSGIGKSLALECASRGMNMLLVALPGPELEQTANEIKSKFNIEVRYFAIDLTGIEAPRSVYEWCKNQNIKVNSLINNAGITGTTIFEKSNPEYSDLRIMLNVRALTLLTRYFIPLLRQCPESKIINICSMAGFLPVPYKSVYSATKAFVLSFSKSLAKELEGSGIRVTVVCPNGIESNTLSTQRIRTHKRWAKLVTITPGRLAKLTLDNAEKGKRIFIPLFINRFLLFIGKIIPDSIISQLLEKEFRDELNY
ncbi:MAG: SDR family NAD(P)-dependent oxidoreductase [Bacteroidales bacterium]|nr:SDR family NAD(P)-dependent oxidoreductase [Bacteroidales bacterium]